MSKKKFSVPIVFLSGGSGTIIGGQSDTGGVLSLRPLPMRFDEWAQSRWCADYDLNGDVDFEDYARWWAQSDFSTDAFTEYTGVMWNDKWSF